MPKQLPLHEFWKALQPEWCEIQGWQLPEKFLEEVSLFAASQSKWVLDQSYRTKIEITGNDRMDFLHRLLTHDIESLKPNTGCYVFFLSAQGKILWDARLWNLTNRILLDAETNVGSLIQSSLEKFLFSEEVTLRDVTSELVHLSFLDTPPSFHPVPHVTNIPLCQEESNLSLWCSPMGFSPQQWDWIGNPKSAISLLQQFHQEKNSHIIGCAQGETWRILHGIPRFGFDFQAGDLLSDTGLEDWSVSETKGCYPGQEVVAKMKTYNGYHQKLAQFQSGAATLEKILKDATGEEIGNITSTALDKHSHAGGLAYLKKTTYEKLAGLNALKIGNLTFYPLGTVR